MNTLHNILHIEQQIIVLTTLYILKDIIFIEHPQQLH